MQWLKTEKINNILFIHLSDEKSQNAFSIDMAEELFSVTKDKEIKGVVLSHEGPFFCSGGNLKFYKELASKEEGLKVNQRISDILALFAQRPLPKACFVNGPCLGGGVELLSCFDYVVASPQSLFGLWQRRAGLSLGWGGGERLLDKIGAGSLKKWLIGAKTISSFKAQELGLVDEIRLADQGLQICANWINYCLSLGPDSLMCILADDSQQLGAFKQLWHGDTHLKVLKKFK